MEIKHKYFICWLFQKRCSKGKPSLEQLSSDSIGVYEYLYDLQILLSKFSVANYPYHRLNNDYKNQFLVESSDSRPVHIIFKNLLERLALWFSIVKQLAFAALWQWFYSIKVRAQKKLRKKQCFVFIIDVPNQEYV